MTNDSANGTFWDHLDILRTVIIKIIAVWCIISVAVFFFKEEVFEFVLAPKNNDFILYRILNDIFNRYSLPTLPPFNVQLINTSLAQQFLIHLKTAMCVGVVFAAPYALYELFGFIAPGLYEKERKYTSRIVAGGYLMFLVGLTMAYLIIFPLTFQFLGTYQVSAEVVNMISLDSYMSTLILMCLFMGIVCELPVVAWLLGKMGVLESDKMVRYRRHAIVVILVVAAIITPTSDIFTLLVVSVPIWLLYELSVLVVRRVNI